MIDRAGDLARRHVDRQPGRQAGDAVGQGVAVRGREALGRCNRDVGLTVRDDLVGERPVLCGRHILDEPGERLVRGRALVVGRGDDDAVGARRGIASDHAGDHAGRRDRETGRQASRRIGQRIAVAIGKGRRSIDDGDRVAVAVRLIGRCRSDRRCGVLRIDREGLRGGAAEAVAGRHHHRILAIERRAGARRRRRVLRGVVVDRARDLARRCVDRQARRQAGDAVRQRIAVRRVEALRGCNRDVGLAVGVGLIGERAVLCRRHVLYEPAEALAGRRTLIVGRGDHDIVGPGCGVAGDSAGDHAGR